MIVLVTLVLAGLMLFAQAFMTTLSNNPQAIADDFSTFTTIFLGIFIEAAPFLLLGTLASGIVEVFINRDDIVNLLPKNALGGSVLGSLMGFGFPVCECGVVPLTRRMLRKGIPPHVGIAFLLASPVVNPIVIVSTMAAFGLSKILFLRIGLSIVIATLTALVFSIQSDPEKLLLAKVRLARPQSLGAAFIGHELPKKPLRERWLTVANIAVDEFFEMGRYLVFGALLASLMQTFVPRSFLLSFNQGPLIPVLAMIALAVLLSVCSTVDSFIALAFITSFGTGSILAFLVFGAMVDIKSTLLFLRVFERKTVAYLIALPLFMTILATVLINIYIPV